MDTEFRLLYPNGYKESDQARMKSYDFITSLQIDDMVVLQNDRYRGYSELTLEKFFSTDPEVLEYRQAILRYCRLRRAGAYSQTRASSA